MIDMALTNDDKALLREEVKSCIRQRMTKQETVRHVMKAGYKESTIKRYFDAFAGD